MRILVDIGLTLLVALLRPERCETQTPHHAGLLCGVMKCSGYRKRACQPATLLPPTAEVSSLTAMLGGVCSNRCRALQRILPVGGNSQCCRVRGAYPHERQLEGCALASGGGDKTPGNLDCAPRASLQPGYAGWLLRPLFGASAGIERQADKNKDYCKEKKCYYGFHD